MGSGEAYHRFTKKGRVVGKVEAMGSKAEAAM